MKTTKFQRVTALVLALVFLLCGSAFSASAAATSSTDKTLSEIKELLNAISYNDYIVQNANAAKPTEEFIIDATKNFSYEINGSSINSYLAGEKYTINAQTDIEAFVNELVTKINTEVATDNADLKDRIDRKYPDATEAEKAELYEASKAEEVKAEDIKSKLAYVSAFGGSDNNGLYTPTAGTATWTIEGITEPTLYTMEIVCYPVEGKNASVERIFKINDKVPFAEARYLTISKIYKNVYVDGTIEVEASEADAMIASATAVGITVTKRVEDGVTYLDYKMPDYWTQESADIIGGVKENGKVDKDLIVRFFTKDIDKNEIRSSLVQAPSWMVYQFKDSSGFMQESFQFVIGPDKDSNDVTISLESVNEALVISEIRLVPAAAYIKYEDYLKQYANEPAGSDKIKIEAEYYSAASSQTIYPVSDNTSAITSPAASDRTLLNTLGGDKWQTAGQWIEYKFMVKSSGMYNISTRFKQSVLDGMYTSRVLYIYSEEGKLNEGDKGYYDGVPFDEATKLQFNYATDWQSGKLTDGVYNGDEARTFNIYFKENVEYTIRLEVSLGNMGDVVRRVEESLTAINNDYLKIIQLTGSSPDEFRDYGFSRVMPDTMIDMIKQARALEAVALELESAADVKSSMTATLDKVSRLLESMGKDDDEVAKNLEQLKTYIGSLGTWLSDAKTQPLVLDYIVIQSADDASLPKAKANFFQAIFYEVTSFLQSFFRNYNRMGAMVEVSDEDAVEVWLAYGRDQSQVIRGLINNDFTPQTGYTVDLKLVSGGTLLPSILADMGPDVYIGIGQNEVINYAIRGALLAIDDMEADPEKGVISYDEAIKDFDESAMLVLGIEDANREMHYYGLPETQNFTMMFVRDDVFADLELEIPKTWEDVKEIIPVLQSRNMEIGMTKDENIFLYQMNGDLFADDGMRINLDSNVALDAFNTMCEMFTMYSFPYKYDFANRFRTGEMPIGFATYTSTYNQLKVFATEIEGLWSFYPLPGYADENGNINNASVSTISAISMIKGCTDVKGAWAFMSWHADDDCQIKYANEMVAILGPSAKHATANISALASLPWTNAELEQLMLQFANLAAIPNYPGRYIVERYTQFAFLAAFNDKADPVTEMQSYIKIINTEITRKRQEFGLETLADGQTLAQKRMLEAEELINEARGKSAYKADVYGETCDSALDLMRDYTTEDYASLEALAKTLRGYDSELFGAAAVKMEQAAASLRTYENYK